MGASSFGAACFDWPTDKGCAAGLGRARSGQCANSLCHQRVLPKTRSALVRSQKARSTRLGRPFSAVWSNRSCGRFARNPWPIGVLLQFGPWSRKHRVVAAISHLSKAPDRRKGAVRSVSPIAYPLFLPFGAAAGGPGIRARYCVPCQAVGYPSFDGRPIAPRS